jgi:DNA-directed RNA polymerase beta' subunit
VRYSLKSSLKQLTVHYCRSSCSTFSARLYTRAKCCTLLLVTLSYLRCNIFVIQTLYYQIFKAISDEDIRALGLHPEYSRPDWLILTVLPVPPPHVRPSVVMDGGLSRSEDDLTHQLVNIIKVNNRYVCVMQLQHFI